ncbi:MAG: InlB B-repeat-containing protein [Bacilli bacterium]|nr:InlB B-repeat-containing protein [Bacilli bacterium]
MAKKKKKKLQYIKMIAYILVLSTLFLSIGWSAYESTMVMESYAYVRIPSEVRVTGFSLYSVNNGAVGAYEDYNVHYVTANASLPNANSTITYEVEITNMQLAQGASVGILDYSGLPEELDIVSWSGYNLKDKICDDQNPSDCGSGAQKTFYITVGYKDASYYDPNDTYFIFDINFDFREFHSITYMNITGNYPTTIIDGDDLDITLNNIPSLQLEVRGTQEYLENTDYTYTNGNLVVDNIEEDLTIRMIPTYTITYNANGGRFNNNQTTNNVTYVWRYNQNNILSGAEIMPTNNGNTFYKWYDDTGYNTEFDITQEINQSKSVYARWVNAVVEMNGTFYTSITNALNAITDNTNYTTITLLKDTSEHISIDTPQKVILDMQNHTISNKTGTAVVTVDGKLKIRNGTITYNNNQNGVINVNSGGDLTLTDTNVSMTKNNGKQCLYIAGNVLVEGNSVLTAVSNQRATVQTISGGQFTITGGSVISTGSKSAIVVYSGQYVTIGTHDGLVDNDSVLIQGINYGIEGKFYLYDGVVKGKNGVSTEASPLLGVEDNQGGIYGTETINGVSYETLQLTGSNTITLDPNGGTMLETVFYVRTGSPIGQLPSPSRGGYVFMGWYDENNQLYNDPTYIVTSDLNLTASWSQEYAAAIGNTYYYSVQDAVNAATNNTWTNVDLVRDASENVTINATKYINLNLQSYSISFNGAAAVVECYGRMEVSNGSVTSASLTNSAFNVRQGGRALINNVNILATGSRQAVYIYGGGYAEMSGTAYISSKTTGTPSGASIERGTVQNLANGTLIIHGGTIVGINQQAVSNEGTLIIGDDDGVIDNSTIDIRGNTYGVRSSVGFSFYDGVLKGQTAAVSGTIATWDTNYTLTDGLETIDGNSYYTKYLAP